MIDLDKDSVDWKKKYPEAYARVFKEVKEKQEKEILEEAKKLGKKQLTDQELFEFQKKKLDSLILEKQAYILKKKLSLYSPEVRTVLQDAVTGLSILEAAEQIDTLIDIYHKTHPAEPIGQSERKDWPEKVDEEKRKRDLDKEFIQAVG